MTEEMYQKSRLFRHPWVPKGTHRQAKGGRNSEVGVIEDMTVQGWLMESDRIIVRAAAISVGLKELKELTAHFKGEQQLFRAAKMEFASQLAVGLTSKRYGGSCEHEEAALELLSTVADVSVSFGAGSAADTVRSG